MRNHLLISAILLLSQFTVGQGQGGYDSLQPPTKNYLPPPGRPQASQQAQSYSAPASVPRPQAQPAQSQSQPLRNTYLPPPGAARPPPQPSSQNTQYSGAPARPPPPQAQPGPAQTYAASAQPPRNTYLPPTGARPPSQQPPQASSQSSPVRPAQAQPQPAQTYSASGPPPRNSYLPPSSGPVPAPAPPPPQRQPEAPRQSPRPQSTVPAPPTQSQPRPAQSYAASPQAQPPRDTYLPPAQSRPPSQSPESPQSYTIPVQQQTGGHSQAQLYYGAASAQGPSSSNGQQGPKPVYGLPGHTPGEPLGPSDQAGRLTRRQSPPQQCKPSDPARNKLFVMAFYQQVIGYKDFEAADSYLTEGYINHNPMIGDGREEFKRALGHFLASAPKIKIDFRRVSAEGDLVWVHTRATNFGPQPQAVVDIFRIDECGRIAEHWDVMQAITENGPNPHPFF